MTAPNQTDTYNAAISGNGDVRTPGLNVIIGAWIAFQDFATDWSLGQQNTFGRLGQGAQDLAGDLSNGFG